MFLCQRQTCSVNAEKTYYHDNIVAQTHNHIVVRQKRPLQHTVAFSTLIVCD